MSKQATPIFGKTKKAATIEKLSGNLERATALYMVDPTGLKHKQVEEFRRSLKKLEAEFTFVKNNLFKRALKEKGQSLSEPSYTGNSAVLFTYKDVVAPLKALTQFFKAAAIGTIRSGLMQQNELSVKDIEKLATLPSREVLLGKLVGQLQAPIYGLHNALSWNMRKLVWTLDAVKAKKA